jgi:hypothetical protein
VTSLTRGRVWCLQLLLALASAVMFGSESRRTPGHILLSQIRDFLFVASYESQGHGGGIRPHLYTSPSFTTWEGSNRSHHPQQFLYYCVLIRFCWFRSNGLVSTSLHHFISVSMDTSVKLPAMVCVQESYLRGKMFACSLPRNASTSQNNELP